MHTDCFFKYSYRFWLIVEFMSWTRWGGFLYYHLSVYCNIHRIPFYNFSVFQTEILRLHQNKSDRHLESNKFYKYNWNNRILNNFINLKIIILVKKFKTQILNRWQYRNIKFKIAIIQNITVNIHIWQNKIDKFYKCLFPFILIKE